MEQFLSDLDSSSEADFLRGKAPVRQRRVEWTDCTGGMAYIFDLILSHQAMCLKTANFIYSVLFNVCGLLIFL